MHGARLISLTVSLSFLTLPSSAQDASTDAERPSPEEERALAAELATLQAESPPPAPPPPGANALNPDISANGLVLTGGTSAAPRRDSDLQTGIHLQEVELRLSANVDPYFHADVTLAADTEDIGFEEAYLSTLEIPYLTIRAGQFAAAIGRHNLLHTHAFPFLTAPLPSRVLLGEDGLRDPGVSLDVLLPLPFFVELNAQVFRGDWAAFGGDLRDDHDFVYVGHLTTLFDLGTDTTLEAGGSYAGGRNELRDRSDILGADLTLKWRPLSAERYTSFDWSTEYLWVQRRAAPTDNRLGGAWSGLRFQFHQRWWIQARGGLLGLPEDDTPRSYRTEALLAFIPSEFSGLRLQYAFETSEGPATPDVHEVFLQAIFSIGPHPPHDY